MAGLRVAVVACDAHGNVDVADLEAKIARYGDRVCAIMLTYPSTHGVFEEAVEAICDLVHAAGGQVYLDGANLNALAGLARVADFGRTSATSTCTRPSASRTAAAGPGWARSRSRRTLRGFCPRTRWFATRGWTKRTAR